MILTRLIKIHPNWNSNLVLNVETFGRPFIQVNFKECLNYESKGQEISIRIVLSSISIFSNSPKIPFSLVQKKFSTNKNVFLSPLNKQKQRFGELEFEYFGGSDVANKLENPNFCPSI